MLYPPKIDPAKETKKITAFLSDTFKKTGKTEAVIAASGGVDSSTSLMLAAKALGPEHLHALYLPSRTTDPIHLEHLRLLLSLAKVPEKHLTIIPVTAIIQKTWRIINHYTQSSNEARATNSRRLQGPGKSPGRITTTTGPSNTNPLQPSKFRLHEHSVINRLRLANLTARARMIVIFDQAKLRDALVIGTENRSEHLLGYYTRFGDEASDVEPIRHLYKTQVSELAKNLGLLTEIINKAPTAGLWFGQTDAAELGFSYEEADPILYLAFEQHLSPKQITQKLAPLTQKTPEQAKALVSKVLTWCERNAFKHHLPYTLDSHSPKSQRSH